jgi:hypothetical protein
VATAAERWINRQSRRLARDAARLQDEAASFSQAVGTRPGPWTEEARSLAKAALGLVQVASSLDGMQEVSDLMTEEA